MAVDKDRGVQFFASTDIDPAAIGALETRNHLDPDGLGTRPRPGFSRSSAPD